MKLPGESPLESEISEFLETCRKGFIPERAVVNILDEIRDILCSPDAGKSSMLWGLEYTQVWPFDEMHDFGEGKITRWLQHRFPSNPT